MYDLLRAGGEAKVLPVLPQLIVREGGVCAGVCCYTGRAVEVTRGSTSLTPAPTPPQMPLKHALNTRDVVVVMRALRVLQALLDLGDGIGRALVPYYRQLLPVLNIFINHTGEGRGEGLAGGTRRASPRLHPKRHSPLSIYPTPSESLGDGIDYAQRHGHIGEVIRDTLVKLEARGGPDAFINVKYIVPTFAKVI